MLENISESKLKSISGKLNIQYNIVFKIISLMNNSINASAEKRKIESEKIINFLKANHIASEKFYELLKELSLDQSVKTYNEIELDLVKDITNILFNDNLSEIEKENKIKVLNEQKEYMGIRSENKEKRESILKAVAMGGLTFIASTAIKEGGQTVRESKKPTIVKVFDAIFGKKR